MVLLVDLQPLWSNGFGVMGLGAMNLDAIASELIAIGPTAGRARMTRLLTDVRNRAVLLSPAFYALAVIAILIVGISKGGFGGGRQNLWIILPGGILGVLVATLTYRWVDEQMLRLLIGAIAVAFALNYYSQAWRRAQPARQASRVRGGIWSAVAGFTSFSAHAGGPPISVYLLPQRLDKTLFVGTTVVFFAFVNYIKLVPYALLGQFRAEILLNALLLAPVAVAGVYLGLWLHHRLSERWFYRLCYALLLLTGLRLLQQGLVG